MTNVTLDMIRDMYRVAKKYDLDFNVICVLQSFCDDYTKVYDTIYPKDQVRQKRQEKIDCCLQMTNMKLETMVNRLRAGK